jgi:hypothetical protein
MLLHSAASPQWSLAAFSAKLSAAKDQGRQAARQGITLVFVFFVLVYKSITCKGGLVMSNCFFTVPLLCCAPCLADAQEGRIQGVGREALLPTPEACAFTAAGEN